jgi:hypothetical protein
MFYTFISRKHWRWSNMDKYSYVSDSLVLIILIENSSRDKDELENIIRILITDNVVRKKFPGKFFL